MTKDEQIKVLREALDKLVKAVKEGDNPADMGISSYDPAMIEAEKALSSTAEAPEDDTMEAITHVEQCSIEVMERAIEAVTDWDIAGLVNTGLVTDMAVAYLEFRKNDSEVAKACAEHLKLLFSDHLEEILDKEDHEALDGLINSRAAFSKGTPQ